MELWRVFESVDMLVWDVLCPTHETFENNLRENTLEHNRPIRRFSLEALENFITFETHLEVFEAL